MSNRKASSLIFLDTSAFVPLLDCQHPLNSRLIQHLKSRNASVEIDAIVLSEFLVGVGSDVDKDVLIDKYTRQFRVPSFDAAAAKVCAELFKLLKSKGQIPKSATDRQITKVDIMIMASAIVSRATEFVFEDKHFAHYPQHFPTDICGFPMPTFIRASDLPDVFVQQELEGLQQEDSSK